MLFGLADKAKQTAINDFQKQSPEEQESSLRKAAKRILAFRNGDRRGYSKGWTAHIEIACSEVLFEAAGKDLDNYLADAKEALIAELKAIEPPDEILKGGHYWAQARLDYKEAQKTLEALLK